MEKPSLPTGIVTFLFTDIQGSTSLWEQRPDLMAVALQLHNAIIRQAVQAHGGVVFKMVGDEFQVAFSSASQALQAAVEAQRGLHAASWNELGPLKVRMGLHAGEAELDPQGDEYVVSHTKNRVARIMSAGNGGQILLSNAVVELLGGRLPKEVTLRDLGEHYLKGLLHPEHLFQVVCPGLPADFPPLRTEDPYSNLPVPTTPFLDRETELSRIKSLLSHPECRLVTLTGIGGNGKTRLAVEAARYCQSFFRNVYFSGLSSITSLDDLILSLAEAVEYSFHTPPGVSLSVEEAKSQLLRYLADKNALFVLDNFEQLTCCAEFLIDLLAASEEIKLIVTSRERLNLPGEWVLEVTGLPFPGWQAGEAIQDFASVQLFIKSAERTGRFHASESDLKAIARICQLLEGMPLGIEMAAAWVNMISPQEIAAEIERDLDFLAASWRRVPERHQTLRAVFDTSWRRLSEEEQGVFCRLAVFRGGFSRDAALRIAGASLSHLAALVDKSFLRRVASGRFEIHPVLKQYAIEILSADPAAQAEARRRHAQYFSKMLTWAFAELKGEAQLETLENLRVEMQNLRTACQELLFQRDFQRLEEMLPALILFYDMNNQRVETQEVINLLSDLEQLLRQELMKSLEADSAGLPPAFFRGLLALTLSALRHFTLDIQSAEVNNLRREESLRMVQDLPDMASKAYAILLDCRGPDGLSIDQKLDLCQHCYAIFKRLDDSWGAALAQLIWADVMNFGNIDIDLAWPAYQASLQTFMEMKNLWGQALCLNGLAFIEQKRGNFESAYRLGCQGLDLFRRLGNYERIAGAHHLLGEIALEKGRMEDARNHFQANLEYFTQRGDKESQRYYQRRLAELES